MTELPENWQENLEAELSQMSATTARLNRLAGRRRARADIMSSSPGPEPYEIRGLMCVCVNCGEPWHYTCPKRSEHSLAD